VSVYACPDATQRLAKNVTAENNHTKRNLTTSSYKELPREDDVKYLNRRLTWHKHIFTKRKQLGMALTKMHWLLGRKSKLSTSNTILIHKATLKPIWTYGIQLWGTAYTSGIEILESFQSEVLSMIVDAPWYVPNTVIPMGLQTPTAKEGMRHCSCQHRARLSVHPNDLVVNLMAKPENRRLRRHLTKISGTDCQLNGIIQNTRETIN
jgi:hypothetical protein